MVSRQQAAADRRRPLRQDEDWNSAGARMFRRAGALVLCAALLVASAADSALAQRRKSAPTAPQSGDRRDQVVTAPGTPWHGRPYWLAMAQCGGFYFRLGNLYAEEAMRVRAAKPDPAATAELNRRAETAGRSAATFLDVAERFLSTDRSLAQEAAIHAYDGQVASAEKLKTVQAVLKAAESCPALHETCRTAVPKICGEKSAARTPPARFAGPGALRHTRAGDHSGGAQAGGKRT